MPRYINVIPKHWKAKDLRRIPCFDMPQLVAQSAGLLLAYIENVSFNCIDSSFACTGFLKRNRRVLIQSSSPLLSFLILQQV